MTIKSFRDLRVWQLAMELVELTTIRSAKCFAEDEQEHKNWPAIASLTQLNRPLTPDPIYYA